MVKVEEQDPFIDHRATDYPMAKLTRDALGTSRFLQRVHVRQPGPSTDESLAELRHELDAIRCQLRGGRGKKAVRLCAGYTIEAVDGVLEAEVVTRRVGFPEQVWEISLALSPLELLEIEDVDGCDPLDVASRMLRGPLSTKNMSPARQEAVIKEHLQRHDGLWLVSWGRFITDVNGVSISGIQEGHRLRAQANCKKGAAR